MPIAASVSATAAKPAEQPHRQPGDRRRPRRRCPPSSARRARRCSARACAARCARPATPAADRRWSARTASSRRKPREREIHVGARPIGQRGAADVADHADDFELAVAAAQAVADRDLAREDTRRAIDFADDHRRDRRGAIAMLEQAAGPQRDVERLEVAAGRRLPADFRRPLARGTGRSARSNADRPVVAGQRRHRRRAGVLDLRQAPRARQTRARRTRAAPAGVG